MKKTLNCREVGLRLQSYLDGEIDPERADQIRAHLDDCVACGLDADAFVKIKKDLSALTVPADSDALSRLREFGAQIAANSVSK